MLQDTALLPSRKITMPLWHISEALGHSNITNTQNYFGSFDDDSLKTMHEGLMAGMEE